MSGIWNIFLVLTKISWSTLEINFIFSHIHVYYSLYEMYLIWLLCIPWRDEIIPWSFINCWSLNAVLQCQSLKSKKCLRELTQQTAKQTDKYHGSWNGKSHVKDCRGLWFTARNRTLDDAENRKGSDKINPAMDPSGFVYETRWRMKRVGGAIAWTLQWTF